MRRVVVLGVALATVAGCAGEVAPPTAARVSDAAADPAVAVVAVGDSITEMDSPDFDAGQIGQGSWAWWAIGHGVGVLGGWAHAGATTDDMLEGVQNVGTGAVRPDVLVLMGGNNDIDWGIPTEDTLDDLVQIAALVHAPRVVLSAVAPEDGLGEETLALDARLEALAQQQGWQYVDPMTQCRDDDGDYRPGTSLDGVHPTEQAAAHIGVALHEALLHPAGATAPGAAAGQTG
ncbi:SGNH/GDSL hydrolase family protein [Klenkia brasiliensis]|uniref:GDSL-like Lipase/Acylhydrolase family protein n=1 Tax=Klenkia brasiliensis TaxID=333142 RepID=A0A1G7T5B7_9ACTN|nr:SGNH/GDSL hydrolase family protein [Klenkia brasiliensis]SDG30421.1 GDSL-like Lipase/Acylhydrolase family protein [Klenkia brasiliensis]